MTIRKKRKFKAIISTFLCLALLGGAVFGISKLLKNDTDTTKIKNSAFAVGGLDEEGKYVENKQTLYTKKMFRCDGLTVELDEDCTSTYQIFFYDYFGNFMESTDVLSENFDSYIMNRYLYARVVITPEIPEDKTAEDFKINFFTKYSYLKGITISVSENQEILSEFDDVTKGRKAVYEDGELTYEEDDKFCCLSHLYKKGSYAIYNIGSNPIYLLQDAVEHEILPGEFHEFSVGSDVYSINFSVSDPVPLVFQTNVV